MIYIKIDSANNIISKTEKMKIESKKDIKNNLIKQKQCITERNKLK